MGSLFRSEPMAMCQLFLQSDAAYQCIAEIGELGLVQFVDLNAEVNAFQRKFVNDVRRCDEMQRQLTFVEKEMIKENVPLAGEKLLARTPLPKDMIDLEAMFEKIEEELRQVNENVVEMNRNYVQLIELKHVLRSVDEFFETRHDMESEIERTSSAGADVPDDRSSVKSLTNSQEIGPPAPRKEQELGFIAGMIRVERFPAFERMLWRVGRGIIFVRQMFIDEPICDVLGDTQRKSVFLVFFPGEQLRQRVRKICEAFRANIYPCPANADQRREAAIGVLQRLEDMRKVFNGSQDHRMKVLVSAARDVRTWKIQVTKMKAVFHIMNMLNVDVTQKCLIAECWIPENDMTRVQAALKRGTEAAGSTFPCIINRVETDQAPPTFNKTNKFTSGFQNIIDSYGVASYREVNPAPYAIITFPFLFAVMFGDAGHGILMTLFALALIVFERPLSRVREEITATTFGGRYIILFMGLFSIYTGFMYNDFFSKSINIFGSSWMAPPINNFDSKNRDPIVLTPECNFRNWSYPFGIDPIWMIASNKIQFTNSYKMKMAVIVGLLQMAFGTMLSLWNHTYFKDRTGFPAPRSRLEMVLRRHLNIWAQLIPELIFLLSLFGYLVFMIIYKWMLPYGAPNGEGPSCARSLLILFINMIMGGGSGKNMPCYQQPLYDGQGIVQKVVVGLALIAVPWLLLGKPLYLLYLQKVHSTPLPPDFVPIISEEDLTPSEEEERKSETSSSSSSHRRKSAVSLHTLKHHEPLSRSIEIDQDDDSRDPSGLHLQKFELGDVMINQIIHTIEYCLGAVSNTASYLRLWALSLAHSQLSEVLWSMVFSGALFSESTTISEHAVASVKIYLSWAGWALLTVCILLIMEGLSAFLHALRLHWVEFMNKFFRGEGYLFTPFNFAEVLREVDD